MAFNKARSSLEKKRVISIFAPQHSLKTLKYKTGCDITRNLYWEARLYAKCYGPGADPPEVKPINLCFTEDELKSVVEFVLSAERSNGLAWGEKHYTTSEGTRYTIPNFQRKCDPEQLWKDYEQLQKAKKPKKFIKRTTFLEIVEMITRTQSTSLAALDIINVRFGTENLSNIKKLIEDIASQFTTISKEDKLHMFQLCDKAAHFLKYTFPSTFNHSLNVQAIAQILRLQVQTLLQ